MKALEVGLYEGTAESLWKTKRTFPLRIWIVDTSGSMATTDGHRVVETPKEERRQIRQLHTLVRDAADRRLPPLSWLP
jgi:Mg-chelatase subunit ChlD